MNYIVFLNVFTKLLTHDAFKTDQLKLCVIALALYNTMRVFNFSIIQPKFIVHSCWNKLIGYVQYGAIMCT